MPKTNGSGGKGTWINEDWSGASGLPLNYRDTVPVSPLSWSRALAIDMNGESRREPGKPLRSGEQVMGLGGAAYVGAEIITFAGRKVLDLFCKGVAGRSLGAKVPLVVDNWKYSAFAPYAGKTSFFRYYTFVPLNRLGATGGSWLTLGDQIKTTELYQSAGYQQNVERTEGGGWRFWHKHLDPTGGKNTLIKQTTNEPKPSLLIAGWQQHDIEIHMHAKDGWIKQSIDGVPVFESEGVMGDDSGVSLNAANFYVLLYGDFWGGGEQHLYIGDVLLSPTPITEETVTPPPVVIEPEPPIVIEPGPEPEPEPEPEAEGIIQSTYCFRYDNGDEAHAGWAAAQGKNTTFPFGKFRLRFQIHNHWNLELPSMKFLLEQSVDGGAWATVPNKGPYCYVGSDHLAFGDIVTAQLTKPVGAKYVPTIITELPMTAEIALPPEAYFEIEFILALFDWAGAKPGVPVQYRLVLVDGVMLDAYLPQIAQVAAHV